MLLISIIYTKDGIILSYIVKILSIKTQKKNKACNEQIGSHCLTII
jgi:hypothetical protein